MLKHIVFLLSLVGLSLCSGISSGVVVDGVPPHTAIGGYGEFIRDPVADSGAKHFVRDITPSSSVVQDGSGLNAHAVVQGIIHEAVGSPRSNGPVHDVVRDVIPGSRAFAQGVVPGSQAVVHDVVPRSRAVVHDVVPGPHAVANTVVPGSRRVVHDVVSGRHNIPDVVHDIPHASNIIRDVVPASTGIKAVRFPAQQLAHAVQPNRQSFLPNLPSFPSGNIGNPFFRPDNGIGTSLTAPSARYVDPASLKCGLKPEPFIIYQYSRFAYNYPKTEIQRELNDRAEIRPAVLALGTHGRFSGKYNYRPRNSAFSHRNKREAGVVNGCMGEALTLRTFYAYNNYCWLVNPVYQDVPFYNCYQECNHKPGYGTVNRCEASYIKRKVLAYCAGLPYGKRIGYVNLPIPTACSCKTYNCS